MKTIHKIFFSAIAASACSIASASATLITADTVLGFVDSGNSNCVGNAAPCGGTFPGGPFPVPVDATFAADGMTNTFVSLPADPNGNSSITLGFSMGTIVDGDGADIFITEVAANGEGADVFVSSDGGMNFTFVSQILTINDGITNSVFSLDLADISFLGEVNAIRIVGLDLGGASDGFDLALVQGNTVVPVPAALPLFISGLAAGYFGKRRRKKSA